MAAGFFSKALTGLLGSAARWVEFADGSQSPVHGSIEVDPATGKPIAGVSVYSAVGGAGAALLSGKTLISAAARALHGVAFANTNASDVWVQVFDAFQISDITLGTTVPMMSIRVPGNGSGQAANAAFWEEKWLGLSAITLTTGLVMAVTTTATGALAPAVALQATVYFK